MKSIIKRLSACALLATVFVLVSCSDKLDEPLGNTPFASETDYTVAADMINPLIGGYA